MWSLGPVSQQIFFVEIRNESKNVSVMITMFAHQFLTHKSPENDDDEGHVWSKRREKRPCSSTHPTSHDDRTVT